MTPQQEALAERIIQLHKDNNGSFEWEVFFYDQGESFLQQFDQEDKFRQLEIIKLALVELKLIDIMSDTGNTTRLTQNGYAFKNFEDERKVKAKKKSEERSISWPQRHWLLLLILSSFVTGVVTYIVSQLSAPASLLKQPIQQQQDIPDKTDTSLKPKYNTSSYDSLKKIKKPSTNDGSLP